MKHGFELLKYGMFVHYVHGLNKFSDGRRPRDINESMDAFDVQGFADDIARSRAQYLIFTAWHFDAIPLYPSAVTARYRGKPQPRRDLLGEVIDAVNARGVKMILYTHPRDGHDFSPADRAATGWSGGDKPDGGFDRTKWNDYIRDLYTELADRYACRLYGFYTDGLGPYDGRNAAVERNTQVVDYLMIRDIMKSRNPDIIMIQNHFGYIFSDDFEMPEGYFGYEDAAMKNADELMPAAEKALAFCPFSDWIVTPECRSFCSPEDMARFILFNASCTVGGGVALAAGPYCEGNVWGPGVTEYLESVGKILSNYRESALDALPSRSFPTLSGKTLAASGYTFFTTSPDLEYEYLHIARGVSTVALPKAEDGAELCDPVSLTAGLTADGFDGAVLSLSGRFDPIDSVIRFRRINAENACTVERINDSNKRIYYTDGWKYHRLTAEDAETALFRFEADVHVALNDGAGLFLAFEGDRVEVFGKGDAKMFVDSVELRGEQPFISPELHGGVHTLYIAAKKGYSFDAVKITKK